MARQKKLTQAAIDRLQPREKRYQVPDPECPGLYLRVTPAGGRSFTIVARDPAGKQVWREVRGAVIGDPLDDVRALAREGVRRLKAGLDPFPPPAPPTDTFETVVARWMEMHVKAKRLRSRAEIERCLNKHILPPWRGREFTSIRRRDITKLLDDIVAGGAPRTADYCLGIIRAVMNWEAARSDDYLSPIVRSMSRQKPSEHKRERILSDDEIRTLWPHLTGSFGALVKLLLLSGQRREKVVAMRWADISIDGVWSIASEAREKGNARELALPPLALDVIRAQPRIAGNDFILAGRGDGPINGFSKSKVALDQRSGIGGWVLHDLRRTARSLMSRAGVRPDVAERVLGHVITGVEGVYDRHHYFDEKRDALAALAALVGRILDPPAENVVPLAGRG